MDFPFVGPSYQARSPNVDCERSINLYPENVEAENGKAKVILVGTPGKTLFGVVPMANPRGAHVCYGTPDRLFSVNSNTLYEIFSDGTSTPRGVLRTLAGFVGMDNSPTQLCVVDGPNGYILDLATNNFTQIIAEGFLGGDTVAFIDNYFAANQPGTINYAISQLADGTAWDGLDHAAKEGSPDPIAAVINLHRQLYLVGRKTSEVWYDSGSNNFPFAPIPGVFLEKGTVAPFSLSKCDNTLYWVGADANGKLVVYRMNGYYPERVSTHAIEFLLNDPDTNFGDASTIVSYAYQEEGHDFYIINSATANTSLAFDASTKLWHERRSFNESNLLSRDRANFHTFVFDKHLMFDYVNGNIYNSDLNVYTTNGNVHPRIRIGPHVRTGLKRVFYDSLQIDMQTGVGLDGTGQGVAPVAILKLSNNGGRSWGNERYTSIGGIGQNKVRARFTQLGSARDRVFWFEVDDPVKVVMIASEVDFRMGLN